MGPCDNSALAPALTHSGSDRPDLHKKWQSDLMRDVYCIMGIPIDAVNLTTVIDRIEAAVTTRKALLISTPNLNFLVNSLYDPEFRESVLDSDLCPPDGAPLIWIARLLGLPVKERAAGSDLLDQLQVERPTSNQISVFLFGGGNGVAAAAANNLNARSGGLACVGVMNPGFCDVSEMSGSEVISSLNSSGADFLILALGAKKGQLWLRRNHDRLIIPVRSHLGAAINFQAGSVKRAPLAFRALGIEWLWRIKEERYLWRRYRDDGFVFLRLLATRVLPLAVLSRWQQLKMRNTAKDLVIEKQHRADRVAVRLAGMATASHVPKAASCFQDALNDARDILIDLSGISTIDARFFGLLLMLRKELRRRGATLQFEAVPRNIRRLFQLNELNYLLALDASHEVTRQARNYSCNQA